jgi:hypothetical protein
VLPDDSRKWIAEIRHVFRRTSKYKEWSKDNKILDAIVIVEIDHAQRAYSRTDKEGSGGEA